jgi:hypothetical protein
MFKGRHFDQSVILLCVRWYLAYGLSLRNLKEMMAERGISIDHSTIHRWVVHFSPLLLKQFNRRKRSVGSKWHMDETYVKVRGQWMYLYRAIDSVGDTVEFRFSEHRDLPAAKRFLRKALERHGQPGGDHLLRCREPPAGSIATSAETNPHSQEPILEQSDRAGSSSHQAAGATDAGFQVLRSGSRYTGRHRDGSYDAEAAGPLRLQPSSLPQRTIRGDRRLKCVLRKALSFLAEYLQRNPPSWRA